MPVRTRPPRDPVVAGMAALAAGALIASAVAALYGHGDPAPLTAVAARAAARTDDLGGGTGGARPAARAGTERQAQPDAPAPDPAGAATPTDAVRGFVAGLATGDTAAAYRLMHPRYRAAVGSYADFTADPAPAQRFGPFVGVDPAGYQSAAFPDPVQGEQVAVVSAYGDITRAGVAQTEAVSLVARRATSGWLVDVGGEGGSTFQTPAEPGGQLAASDDVVLWTPSAGLVRTLAVLDGRPREPRVRPLTEPGETSEARVADRSPGRRQVAVAMLREDGSVDAVATWFVRDPA